MEDIVYYNNLYDLYGELLTEKQKNYFEDYYFHNLSYSEMADNHGISRNAAFKQLHIVLQKLEEYEKHIHLSQKKERLIELSKQISDDVLREKILDIF